MYFYCVNPALPDAAVLNIREWRSTESAVVSTRVKGELINSASSEPADDWLKVAEGWILVRTPSGLQLVLPWEQSDFISICTFKPIAVALPFYTLPDTTSPSKGEIETSVAVGCYALEGNPKDNASWCQVYYPSLEIGWVRKENLIIVEEVFDHPCCNEIFRYFGLHPDLPLEAVLAVRPAPSKESDPIGIIDRSAKIKASLRSGDWLKINYEPYESAWVMWNTPQIQLCQAYDHECERNSCIKLDEVVFPVTTYNNPNLGENLTPALPSEDNDTDPFNEIVPQQYMIDADASLESKAMKIDGEVFQDNEQDAGLIEHDNCSNFLEDNGDINTLSSEQIPEELENIKKEETVSVDEINIDSIIDEKRIIDDNLNSPIESSDDLERKLTCLEDKKYSIWSKQVVLLDQIALFFASFTEMDIPERVIVHVVVTVTTKIKGKNINVMKSAINILTILAKTRKHQFRQHSLNIFPLLLTKLKEKNRFLLTAVHNCFAALHSSSHLTLADVWPELEHFFQKGTASHQLQLLVYFQEVFKNNAVSQFIDSQFYVNNSSSLCNVLGSLTMERSKDIRERAIQVCTDLLVVSQNDISCKLWASLEKTVRNKLIWQKIQNDVVKILADTVDKQQNNELEEQENRTSEEIKVDVNVSQYNNLVRNEDVKLVSGKTNLTENREKNCKKTKCIEDNVHASDVAFDNNDNISTAVNLSMSGVKIEKFLVVENDDSHNDDAGIEPSELNLAIKGYLTDERQQGMNGGNVLKMEALVQHPDDMEVESEESVVNHSEGELETGRSIVRVSNVEVIEESIQNPDPDTIEILTEVSKDFSETPSKNKQDKEIDDSIFRDGKISEVVFDLDVLDVESEKLDESLSDHDENNRNSGNACIDLTSAQGVNVIEVQNEQLKNVAEIHFEDENATDPVIFKTVRSSDLEDSIEIEQCSGNMIKGRPVEIIAQGEPIERYSEESIDVAETASGDQTTEEAKCVAFNSVEQKHEGVTIVEIEARKVRNNNIEDRNGIEVREIVEEVELEVSNNRNFRSRLGSCGDIFIAAFDMQETEDGSISPSKPKLCLISSASEEYFLSDMNHQQNEDFKLTLKKQIDYFVDVPYTDLLHCGGIKVEDKDCRYLSLFYQKWLDAKCNLLKGLEIHHPASMSNLNSSTKLPVKKKKMMSKLKPPSFTMHSGSSKNSIDRHLRKTGLQIPKSRPV